MTECKNCSSVNVTQSTEYSYMCNECGYVRSVDGMTTHEAPVYFEIDAQAINSPSLRAIG